jgi:chloramphenicol-sensitive protein RarD
LLYVYAINSGHILAGSLGYYLNPLANILLGRFILKERLSGLQWAAVGIAAAGIAVLAAGALGTLWISLTLCFSFATYGLLRKIVHVESLAGLTIETMLLFPIALGWLLVGASQGQSMFGSSDSDAFLLMAAGIVSTVPLLCFTAAARRLPYSTVGMLQFIAPTLQFLLAVAVYDEPFTTAHGIAFACIWTALVLYLTSMIRDRRAAQVRECSEMAEP